MISIITQDKPNQSVFYKIDRGIKLSQDDLNVAYKVINYKLAYKLAKLQDVDIEKCQEVACKEPRYAYYFALNIKGANIKKCEEAACKSSFYAYYFARFIPGANIEKCQEICLKDPEWAYYFAKDIRKF